MPVASALHGFWRNTWSTVVATPKRATAMTNASASCWSRCHLASTSPDSSILICDSSNLTSYDGDGSWPDAVTDVRAMNTAAAAMNRRVWNAIMIPSAQGAPAVPTLHVQPRPDLSRVRTNAGASGIEQVGSAN